MTTHPHAAHAGATTPGAPGGSEPLAGPLGVHHLAVLVTDLPRAERFYGGVLGLPVNRRWSDDAGAPRSIWFELGAGGFLAVELAQGRDSRDVPAEGPGWLCAVFATPQAAREGWRARLAAAGHPVERETAYTLYTRDPDGTLVGLSHFPDPA